MTKLIHDELEIKKFYDLVLPDLKEEEVYYVSLSARTKYLRSLGIIYTGSEMFDRKTIKEKSWNLFIRTIRKYECNPGGYLLDDGSNIPSEAITIYFNIDPVNVIEGAKSFLSTFTENIFNYTTNRGSSLDYFKRLERNILTEFHRAKGTRHYIDIDIDIHEGYKYKANTYQEMARLYQDLEIGGIRFFVLDTHSGYHIMLKKDSITFDYTKIIDKYKSNIEIFKDVSVNSNKMIPLPGTLQAGYPVRILYDLSNF